MNKYAQFCLMMIVASVLTGCGPKVVMTHINSGGPRPIARLDCPDGTCSIDQTKERALIQAQKPAEEKREMLIEPHMSLGLYPTDAVRNGNISARLWMFSKRLFGEYFPGRIRWNTWTIRDDGTEVFGQLLFTGMHPDGNYCATNVTDGQIESGQAAALSTTVDFIYSPFDKELEVERGKFLSDPQYRAEMIRKVNIYEDGTSFDIKSLTKIERFQDVIKTWNQIKYPGGYLLSPLGSEEVALIRGINPQYTYFQKLIGTGDFAIRLSPNPAGMAIANASGLAMDLIRAWRAPSKGWDYLSEVPSRRNMAFIMEYALALAETEIKNRNAVNVDLLRKAQGASGG